MVMRWMKVVAYSAVAPLEGFYSALQCRHFLSLMSEQWVNFVKSSATILDCVVPENIHPPPRKVFG